ncbi:MAG: hypothetical protein ACLFUZ_02900 [Candidatus Micrarchaeia archaeon]
MEENEAEEPEIIFKREEDLLAFVEERTKQINNRLNDLERAQFSESREAFRKHAADISDGIGRLQEIIKKNYINFSGGKNVVENWEEISMYSWTVRLQERLTEIKDTNTVGV